MGLPNAYTTDDSVLTLLGRPDIAPLFYVMVSGIPYVFSNQALPDAWNAGGGATTIGSEDYTWSQTLIVGDDFGSLSMKVEPKRGLGVAGSQTFEFSLTGDDDAASDVWLSLLVRDFARTDKAATNLAADLDVDTVGGAEDVTVDDASDFSTSESDVYIGTETLRAGSGSNTATTINDIGSRGAYKSWAQPHRVTSDPRGESAFAGPFVTTWPVVWEGRVVRLYMALGVWDSAGDWKPYKTSGSVRVLQEVYKGLITGVGEGNDTMTVSLETASLDHVLRHKVATRLPATTIRKRTFTGDPIYIGAHNWYLSWTWHGFDNSVGATAAETKLTLVDQRLYTGAIDVPEGLYSIENVVTYIAATIKEYGIPQSSGATEFWPAGLERVGVGKKSRTRFGFTANSTNIATYDLTLHLGGGQHITVIRDLGFTSDAHMDQETVVGSNSAFYATTSNEPPPAFRWPGRNRIAPGRIYYEKLPTDALQFVAPGYVDDDGVTVPKTVLIDKAQEIIAIGTGATTTYGGATYYYYEVDERGLMNTGKTEDTVLKFDPGSDKQIKLTQGIYMPNTSLHRALFYLMMGGSGVAGTMHATWDKGWSGTGLALPSDLIDITGITTIAENISPKRDQVWIDKPTALRDWLAPELLIEQVLMVAQADFDAGDAYAMTWVETHPPSEVTGSNERTLDHSNTLTFGGGNVGLDRQENKIINSIALKVAYSHGAKKFGTEIKQTHVTSQQTWGERESLTMQVKTIGGAADSSALAVQLAQRMFDRYALPYEIIELDASNAATWGWQVGDIVNITNTALPKLDAPGRGWTDVKARLMVKKDNLMAGNGVSSRLTMVKGGSMGFRYSRWAPSAIVASQHSGNEWNVTAHEYSRTTDPVDVSHFAAGYKVTLYRLGSASTTQALTIDSVDEANNRVTFTTAVSGMGAGGDIVMVFADYGTASIDNEQIKYAYMSDFDGVLGTADIPFRYS